MKRFFASLVLSLLAFFIHTPIAGSDVIGGYPLRPLYSTTLAGSNVPWVGWAGTTIAVSGQGGTVHWAFRASSVVASGGQILPYAVDMTVTLWVSETSAVCWGDYCTPNGDGWVTWGPTYRCTLGVSGRFADYVAGDSGCWPARSAPHRFYTVTAFVSMRVPLDRYGGDHVASLVSAPIFVP